MTGHVTQSLMQNNPGAVGSPIGSSSEFALANVTISNTIAILKNKANHLPLGDVRRPLRWPISCRCIGEP